MSAYECYECERFACAQSRRSDASLKRLTSGKKKAKLAARVVVASEADQLEEGRVVVGDDLREDAI